MNSTSTSQNPSKCNLLRKPSVKKPPEIRQTKTSLNRMFKANPLLRFELEGKPIPTTNLKDFKIESISKEKATLNVNPKSNLTSLKVQSLDTRKANDNPKNAVSKYPNYLKSSSNLKNKNDCIRKNFKQQVTQTTNPKPKQVRRSLSAQHFDRKKGIYKAPESCYSHHNLNLSRSMEVLGQVVEEVSTIFKTPSAYERRSFKIDTPMSVNKWSSLNRTSTPRLPSQSDLQKRLNNWLAKRGKSLSNFHHLKCFGLQNAKTEPIDEENKENIEVENDLDKGSYENLEITPTQDNLKLEEVAKAALLDLHKLIIEGYDRDQCEHWLLIIKRKFEKLEEQPEFWECRAAIEQARGNIAQAVEYYQNAIIQGAEIKSVDKSLDHLLEKFSLLNINTEEQESKNQRLKIVQDARNVFKSSIIQFAIIKQRNLKEKVNEEQFLATPVRRSTRLSRCMYVSTPGVSVVSSLREVDTSIRETLMFKTNKALQ